MTPQVHAGEVQPGEQASLSFKQRRLPIVDSSAPRKRKLLTILGVAVAFIGGLLVFTLQTFEGAVLAMSLGSLIGATLIRSRWGLLVVPLTLYSGVITGAVLVPLLQGGWIALQARAAEFFEPLDMVVFLGFVPVFVITVLGTLVGFGLATPTRSAASNNQQP